MVTETECAEAALEVDLAVSAARQAQVEVDDARLALKEM